MTNLNPEAFEDSIAGNESENLEQKKREREQKIAWIRVQVDKSLPILNTPAERYLKEHRGLQGPWPESLRWAPEYQHKENSTRRPCLLATVTDDAGQIVAVQSMQLNTTTGKKAAISKPDRYSNGPIGDGSVLLRTGTEPTQTLVIGEGVETVLTRIMVSPCDAHVCLGSLRFIKSLKHHKRVEILADTDKRDDARRLAREYAEKGLSAHVVTVPDTLGAKGDLNDVLQNLGLSAVYMAVEDAEHISKSNRVGLKNFVLEIGSDVEIAQKIIGCLEEIYGPIIVCDGKVWRFDRTHWVAFEMEHLARFIHRADGAIYDTPSGNQSAVRLNKNRVSSILDAMLKYNQQPDYFKNAPFGINCESGFVQISDYGSVSELPHARRWRQRHLVRGKWHPNGIAIEIRDNSLFRKYLGDCFRNDPENDAKQKIYLLSEIAGCVALGMGTQIGNPKAIVAFSEEGGTGKSTFLIMLRAMPNPGAVASVPAGKFGDEKYAHRLIGKVLNAVDELPDRAIRSDVFKRMITGDPVPARDLYCSATDFVPVALHVFSTNVLPTFSGGIDGGTARRLLPVEFTHVVPEDERDPQLANKIIHDEADLLLDFAIEGARRLIQQKGFSIPDSSKALLAHWFASADPVRAWAAERVVVTNDGNTISVAGLYQDFELWAQKRGVKFLPNAISFGKRLATAIQGGERHRSDGSHYRNLRLRPLP